MGKKIPKNPSVGGVNWSSLRKFADFYFGEGNILNHSIFNERTYVLYLERGVYERNPKQINKFENKFLVTIKAMDKVD